MCKTTDQTLIEQFRSSALTQEVFCKANNIPINRLRYLLYKKKAQANDLKSAHSLVPVKPAFISFQNNSLHTHPKDIRARSFEPRRCTIISGEFTLDDIAVLLNNSRSV
jgi:hypothetical protein